jgi:hypothetical protein
MVINCLVKYQSQFLFIWTISSGLKGKLLSMILIINENSVQNLTGKFYILIFYTDNPSADQLLHIIAPEGHSRSMY